jgi:DNA-binding response OmpR family regulator
MSKLMLIEDDETMSTLIRTLLEIEGFQVAPSTNKSSIDEILQSIRTEKPALVLLDVHLRNINGLDLLRKMRQDETFKETRVLMTSGMELSKECCEVGADDFILKPFMPDELIRKIRNTLGN